MSDKNKSHAPPIIIMLVITVVSLFAWIQELRAENDIVSLGNLILLNKFAELDRQFNKLDLVVKCESGYKHQGLWGDIDYHYPAYGIAQFQERTFKELAQKASLEGASIYNKADQTWLLNWAIENGYGKYWTCYNIKIGKKEKTNGT